MTTIFHVCWAVSVEIAWAIERLEEEVNNHLASGWQMYGEMNVYYVGKNDEGDDLRLFTQSLIRVFKDETSGERYSRVIEGTTVVSDPTVIQGR